jgi:hypothetical protein
LSRFARTVRGEVLGEGIQCCENSSFRGFALSEAPNREALKSLTLSADLDVEYPLGMLLDEE